MSYGKYGTIGPADHDGEKNASGRGNYFKESAEAFEQLSKVDIKVAISYNFAISYNRGHNDVLVCEILPDNVSIQKNENLMVNPEELEICKNINWNEKGMDEIFYEPF